MGRTHQQGTAIVGGDVSGNIRGSYALDIQTTKSAVTQVASGDFATAAGGLNTASGNYSTAAGYNNLASGENATAIGRDNTASASYNPTAIGYSNTASGNSSSAIGRGNTASGTYGSNSAIGYNNTASADYSSAIGYRAESRVEQTTNICGPQINRKDDGETAGTAFESFCGVEVVLMTKEVDLKVVADHTLTLPSNCKFWLDEIGLIATSIDTLTVQPTIRFGITGTPAKQNAAAITTTITAAGKREIEVPLVPEDGETSLVGGITIAATATTAKGRFWFKGLLVENE